MSQKTSILSRKRAIEILGAILLIAVFVLPFISLGKSDKIYADDSASGTEDGSSSHPYKKISSALKHADAGDKVIVKPGTYKENIEISKDVRVVGESNTKVIIKAKNENEPAVSLRDDAEINNVSIQDGEYGVRVKENAEAKILSCVIKDNEKSGIEVLAASVDKKHEVVVRGNIIKNNGKKGIFSQKRYISIIDNEIVSNGNDGIDIAGGSYASIEGNLVKKNSGSGMKLVLDGSSIWTRNNRFAENKREGVEINAYGKSGKVELKSSKLVDNGRFAVARVLRGNVSSAVFNGLSIAKDVEYWGNTLGNISHFVWVK